MILLIAIFLAGMLMGILLSAIAVLASNKISKELPSIQKQLNYKTKQQGQQGEVFLPNDNTIKDWIDGLPTELPTK